ncbi:hypothetical protein OG204_00805 [Streptomyces sp. NBC_01387]|uniref:hypothetical protein n=1 Tax=unclassified Streptomyces TaxID=2593676 RepID=UPI002024868A|nr:MULTISPECIES: hypothetical protein [unclassified Streptomyces]WSC24433.1 hypothetical protein OIE60_34850 [Streptomyces sp. NBC_01766]
MSRYRLQYAPPADQARAAMDTSLRTRFDTGMRRITTDPYGQGSAPVGKDDDRREAAVAGVVIRYYVSQNVLVVTVVRAVYI